jgi:hypothetical protein
MTQGSFASMKRSIFGILIATCAFATPCVSSQAADLGSDFRPGVRHVRTAWNYSSWRDRCAWAGYYCLYAWDGYVYSYPWDDRPSALAHARRHRHRY